MHHDDAIGEAHGVERARRRDISSSVWPAARAFLRRPAVSCSRISRPSACQRAAMASRVMPASGPVSARSAAEQAVEQAGLAHIGPPDDGQPQRLVRSSGFLFGGLFSLRANGAQRIDQLVQAQAVLGRDRERLAEAQRPGLGVAWMRRRAFAFVGGQHDRLARAAQRLGHDLVGRGDAFARRRSGTGRHRRRRRPSWSARSCARQGSPWRRPRCPAVSISRTPGRRTSPRPRAGRA